MSKHGGSMKSILTYFGALGAGAWLLATPATGATIFNNLTPNNQMAVASRPGSGSVSEIEAADDFLLGSHSVINSASFVGLLVGDGNFAVSDVNVEIYQVFPNSSDPNRIQNV